MITRGNKLKGRGRNAYEINHDMYRGITVGPSQSDISRIKSSISEQIMSGLGQAHSIPNIESVIRREYLSFFNSGKSVTADLSRGEQAILRTIDQISSNYISQNRYEQTRSNYSQVDAENLTTTGFRNNMMNAVNIERNPRTKSNISVRNNNVVSGIKTRKKVSAGMTGFGMRSF